MPDLQLYFGLLVPSGIFPLQKMAEEPLLQVDTVVGVKLTTVFQPVDFEPLVLARRTHKSLEIAARVQPLPAPIRRGEKRHLDLRPVGHSGLPEIIGVQLVRQTVFVKIPAIAAEFLFRERLRARNPATGHATLE